MPRSPRAYLADIIDACDAIAAALREVELSRYESDRLIRSAVEREFILIGEALASLARLDALLTARISNVRMIVGFRNLLTHDYAAVRDATVWATAVRDAPVLRDECQALLDELEEAD
jgi:uncharacterized protein with HEPN domain